MKKTHGMRNLLLFGMMFLVFQGCLSAQNILVIDKPGKAKRKRYYPGDFIALQLKDDPVTYKDSIHLINQKDRSLILGTGQKIYLSRVEKIIDYEKRKGVRFAIHVLYRGGLALFGVSTFNRAINDDQPVVNKGIAIGSGAALALGTALLPFARKKYKAKKYRYRIVNLDPE